MILDFTGPKELLSSNMHQNNAVSGIINFHFRCTCKSIFFWNSNSWVFYGHFCASAVLRYYQILFQLVIYSLTKNISINITQRNCILAINYITWITTAIIAIQLVDWRTSNKSLSMSLCTSSFSPKAVLNIHTTQYALYFGPPCVASPTKRNTTDKQNIR